MRSRHYLFVSRLLSLADGNKWPANSLIGVKFFVYVTLEQRACTCPVALWTIRYCPPLQSRLYWLLISYIGPVFINYVCVGDSFEVRPLYVDQYEEGCTVFPSMGAI